MGKIHHLNLQERQSIEEAITQGLTKAEIGRKLGKDPAGISREIKRHRELRPRNAYNRPVLCGNRRECKKRCVKPCDQYKEPVCNRRDISPGACNGCEKRSKCPLDKYLYHAVRADTSYRASLTTTREGINMTPEERDRIGGIIAPLLKQGQSVYQVKSAHPGIDLSDRTMYRYIESGVFKAFGVDNFSLKEQVNRKLFHGKYKKRKEPANYDGRRYQDYLAFLKDNPESRTVEMDTVYNHSGGPYLQTFIFPEMGFMVGRLHNEKTNESMSSSLDYYQERLGLELFRDLFPLILTDRGTEFEKHEMFERDKSGSHRLNIFYCDPMQSSQKPHVENNHNYVRDIIPNGKPMTGLTQAHMDLMFSHINSVPRKSLHGKTPFEIFVFYFGRKAAELLAILEIPRDRVVLLPSLIFGENRIEL
jgi:transposase, IS30 family